MVEGRGDLGLLLSALYLVFMFRDVLSFSDFFTHPFARPPVRARVLV